MANPQTGDFEAVLQVSGLTINRLMASLHQNFGVKPGLPVFPHSSALRVGDPKAIDGLRGTARVQAGAPHIELIHGSTDRFWLQVDIRARYKPDAGTKPLPEFIQGVVKAQYRLEGIDPACRGWGKRAAEYLWIRVVDDSVSFTGTAVDDLNLLQMIAGLVDDDEVNARITRVLTRLLKTNFEATPHRVSKRFRRGAMRSLHPGPNQSAVVLPIGLSGEPVGGRIESVDQDFLDGRDFGVAISRDYILSKVQPVLDDIRANFDMTFSFSYKANLDVGVFDVDVVTVNITWRVNLTKATASWSGGLVPLLGMSAGVITINISGAATTSKSIFNITFDVTQLVMVTFDPSSERFVVTIPGSPVVSIHPKTYEGIARSRIANQVKPQVQAAVNQLVGELDLSTRKAELIDQLRTLDDQADAHFDEAEFGPDGVVVRGRIILSPRRKPVGTFGIISELDALTAFESWIPGGGITRFEWSWNPFNNAGTAGNQITDDRFLLRRPPGKSLGKFGAVLGVKTPLPGLDIGGTVCLNIRGVQMDAGTGAMVAIDSGRKCHRFGYDVRAISAISGGRLFLKEYALPKGDPSGPVQESGIIDVGRAGSTASNTLIAYVGDRWNAETATVLRDALRACDRNDSGMLVLILFREGALAAGGEALRAELDRLAEHSQAPIMANEDVNGGWAASLALEAHNRGVSWRLLSPGGGVTWMHNGRLTPDELAVALDHFLLPSAPPQMRTLESLVSVGMQLDAKSIYPTYSDLVAEMEPRCPPMPLDRTGSLGSVVAFVQHESISSRTQLRELAAHAAQSGGGAPVIIGIVDSVNDDEAERLREELGVEFTAIADPGGVIASRFGIRVWPTTVSINSLGVVSGIEVGHSRKLERVDLAASANDQVSY